MAFIQDPRLRQRWNQISHNAEAVTENAAAGIWTFQHQYITPCLSSLADSIDSCTSLCLGDREERARRARERDRGAHRTRAEYMFDFYDDWDDDFAADQGTASSGGGGGLFSGWGGEDWDRLLAGTGNDRRHAAGGTGDVVDQPRRKRGMSYGTRGGPRRKASLPEDDPTVIPRTAPLGFLGRLPFKFGGTLRYKPSAANLRDHPGALLPGQQQQGGRRHRDENEPLLGTSSEEGEHARNHEQHARESPQLRPRSNTGESEGTSSSSYRSRNDIFPSDGEGDEDAVPLDDEFAVALGRVDDGSSNRTRSTKGKRPANGDRESGIARSVSRTTIASTYSAYRIDDTTIFPTSSSEDALPTPSLEDLQREEEQAEREEYEEIERKRKAASRLATQRGLRKEEEGAPKPEAALKSGPELESKQAEVDHGSTPEEPTLHKNISQNETRKNSEDEMRETKLPAFTEVMSNDTTAAKQTHNGGAKESMTAKLEGSNTELQFIPARLPHFG
ncbi:hypothetical protein NEUTE1DRAFT_144158 [Neurospora tetrasperma FGSC 2508]|uniref:Uncharacterized protein n=1 Tax=Neurospora tetrasperma (strain FGSC 2508 / ATCC MYA-4615 / P0657) TaxID=510951 RepID=F8MEH5_NEUT8|nr:uncharacterized protein NEUTE1DRAFT_144158 [Neurospora tetrasperma FGSC 2508]EGO60806.1 hypothetical protein NEUTE1DRAFT_144158 [Neurospora tetrasperma FGSC 2508]EGZ75206.1 hypothetical protein NEUTE2DRAFT_104685 [Neurospora tetrasperma FGSC 2509]